MARRLLIAFLSMLMTSTAGAADTPIGNLQRDLHGVTEDVKGIQAQLNEATAQNQRLTDLLEHVAASQLATAAGVPTREAAAASAAERKPAVDVAVAAVESINAASLPDGLKNKIETCVKAARDLTVPSSNEQANPRFEIPECGAAVRQDIQRELEQAETKVRQDWDKCRQVLVERKPAIAAYVPSDPTDSSTVQANLAKLSNTWKDYGDAKECADTLNHAVDTFRDKKKAESALASALAMAAQVCFSSGGNPYVCGGMLAVAVLMELFGNHGNGDGNGPMASETGLPGIPAPGPVKPETLQDTQAVRPTGGNLDSEPTGNLHCDASNGVVTCWVGNNQKGTLAKFDSKNTSPVSGAGPEAFRTLVAHPAPGAIFPCTNTAGDAILGIVVKESPTAYWPVYVQRGSSAAQVMGAPSRTLDCKAFSLLNQ